jgi:homogentisate 1,2-dioxygenase
MPMPHYHTLGAIPHKRHTRFHKPDGGLYAEQLFSTEGFSGAYSLLYHCHPPTRIIRTEKAHPIAPPLAGEIDLRPRSFEGFRITAEPDYLNSRRPLLVNQDVALSLAAPEGGTGAHFFKNADADELWFIHEGSGTLGTPYGTLTFKPGDYLVIPRGTLYQVDFTNSANRLLILESFSPIHFPRKYRSAEGQLLEHAPYCERDIRPPEALHTRDEKGDFRFLIKKQGWLHAVHYDHHPFDVIGWDGCCYPFAFSVHDFEPITGRIHQPPPVHLTFEARNFVVCSFCPRKFDYHPQSIPAPYNHSNIDSDEVLYYAEGDFMSRKNVTRGQLTLHPAGIPHGPHPGAVEKSLGREATDELAVMVDTFHPLQLTDYALHIEDKAYWTSWMD